MSFDFDAGRWVPAEVVQRHDNLYTGPVVTIHAGGSRIEATSHHPFWVVEGRDLADRPVPRKLAPGEDTGLSLPGRWVDSHDLRAGDVILDRNCEQLLIEAIEQRWEEDLPVSNLTVRDHQTYAVGEDGALVHNASWCSTLERITKGIPEWIKPPGLIDKLDDLIRDGIVRPGTKIHAHHIVMKGVFLWDLATGYVRKSKKILEDSGIKLLGTVDELAAASVDELDNLTWAINGYGGIHSKQYAKAVYERLAKVFDPDAPKALNHQKVKMALNEMSELFKRGEIFW